MTAMADTSRCFVLPDLVSYCQFPLRCNPHGDATQTSTGWLTDNFPELSSEQLAAVHAVKVDLLSAYGYPDCDTEHLRVAGDFLAILFLLDDLTDTMKEGGTEQLANTIMDVFRSEGKLNKQEDEQRVREIAKDFWTRFIRDAKPCVQTRFRDKVALFFKAVRQEAQDRERGVLPDLESYIIMRRDTSACRPSFDLIEYTMGIELPRYVVDDPIVRALNQSANDLVAWSNDIYSFNNEQAHGIYNIIVILMKSQGLEMQDAIDHVGDLFKQTIDGFMENTQLLPSWGAAVDADVRVYVQGLQDWIVGNLHWSFASERYFGKRGAEIKATRVVELLPKKSVS